MDIKFLSYSGFLLISVDSFPNQREHVDNPFAPKTYPDFIDSLFALRDRGIGIGIFYPKNFSEIRAHLKVSRWVDFLRAFNPIIVSAELSPDNKLQIYSTEEILDGHPDTYRETHLDSALWSVLAADLRSIGRQHVVFLEKIVDRIESGQQAGLTVITEGWSKRSERYRPVASTFHVCEPANLAGVVLWASGLMPSPPIQGLSY